jgi:hypothetical protein
MARVYSKPTLMEKSEDVTAQMSLLKEHFEIAEEAKVAEFLQEYPFLTDYAVEAKARLAKLYRDAEFTLEVLIDPEDYDGSTFEVLVNTSLTPDQARAIFDQFAEDWWMDASIEAQGKLVILRGYK